MTRHIQPPDYPTTGHPYVDNALRNAWREYRDYLQQHNPYGRYVQLYYGASLIPENIFFDRTKLVEEPPIPRKLKKDLTKKMLAEAFTYYEPDHYTPKGVLL